MRAIPFFVCTLSLGVALSARADTSYYDTVPGRSDFAPVRAIAAGDGFALLGVAGGSSAIAWYGADGSLTAARFFELAMPTRPFGVLDAVPTADGGIFLLYGTEDSFGPVCRAAKLRADTEPQWIEGGAWTVGCRILGSDAPGGVWVGDDIFAQHLAADGVSNAKVGLGQSFGQAVAATVDAESAALLVGAHTGSGGRSELSLLSYDGKTRRALWQAPDDTTEILHVALGGDGNVYALGNDASGGFALSLAPGAASLRWSKALGASIVAGAAGANGTQAAIDEQGQLSVIAADGAIRWQQTPALDACDAAVGCSDRRAQLAFAANGDVLLLSSYVPELLRFDTGGNAVARTRLTHKLAAGAKLTPLSDASSVITPLSVADGAQSRRTAAAQVMRDGSVRDPAHAGILPLPETTRASTQDASGAVYVLSEAVVDGSTPAQRSWLGKIAPGGKAAWKQSVEGGTYDALLQADATRVCFSWTDPVQKHLQCRRAADGALLWDQGNAGVQALGLMADGSTIAVFGDGVDNDALRWIAADGTVLHEATLPGAFTRDFTHLAVAANGTTVIAALLHYQAVYAFDRNGVQLYRSVQPIDARFDRALSVGADGSAVVLTQGNQPYAWRLAPNGQTLWTTWAGDSAAIAPIGGGTVSLLGYRSSPFAVVVSNLDASSGAPQGAVTLGASPPPASTLQNFQFSPGVLVSVTFDGMQALQIVLYAANDGRVLRTLIHDCGNVCGNEHFAARLGDDGTLRLVASGVDDLGSDVASVIEFDHATLEPSAVRADQAGIDGLWYAPYEPGQGFAFDYMPASGLLFAPWFTYAPVGGPRPDPAALAWYTLQGNVASGATEVDLAIGRNAPGTFNSGSVAAMRVGSASVRFGDCDHALLLYQFDANVSGTYGGAIALARLSPSTAVCELTDGSTGAAEIANAPAHGFDARQSGTWYDPDTTGQGLQLSVIPAGNGFDGLLVGAWFTFDPPGGADDAQKQHWFTLQGDLRTAANGQVQLPILRTLGGMLDFFPTHDTVRVGAATLTFLACDRARFDFAFDSSEVAHAYAGLRGGANLIRIGGCAPP